LRVVLQVQIDQAGDGDAVLGGGTGSPAVVGPAGAPLDVGAVEWADVDPLPAKAEIAQAGALVLRHRQSVKGLLLGIAGSRLLSAGHERLLKRAGGGSPTQGLMRFAALGPAPGSRKSRL